MKKVRFNVWNPKTNAMSPSLISGLIIAHLPYIATALPISEKLIGSRLWRLQILSIL